MTTVKAEAPEANRPLLEARTRYRTGLITLGEFFALIDRFLDGIVVVPPTPTAEPKETKVEKEPK
jgi:hypothetical protein